MFPQYIANPAIDDLMARADEDLALEIV